MDTNKSLRVIVNVSIAIGAILAFAVSIQLMGVAFKAWGSGTARSILEVTSNPFVGLFIGLLVTAILQSSSTTTSLAVAAVASGSVSLQHAVPIIMGANIGTTITSTIVSLGYITKKNEFRKAISAGTSHDIFNVIVVLLLFPLELKYQFLARMSRNVASLMKTPEEAGDVALGSLLQVFAPLENLLLEFLGPIVLLFLSVFLLFGTIKFISSLLYDRLIGPARRNLDHYFFGSQAQSFGWGLLFTGIVQSSSLTTSLIVPLVATGKVKVDKAFQFILGANLGTTITAFLAALFQSEAAISLAIAHFMFNLIGVLIFLIIPAVNRIPTFLSDRLGYYTLKNRLIGFVYVLVTFFLLPFSLIYFSDTDQWVAENQRTEVVEEK